MHQSKITILLTYLIELGGYQLLFHLGFWLGDWLREDWGMYQNQRQISRGRWIWSPPTLDCPLASVCSSGLVYGFAMEPNKERGEEALIPPLRTLLGKINWFSLVFWLSIRRGRKSTWGWSHKDRERHRDKTKKQKERVGERVLISKIPLLLWSIDQV